MSFPFLYIVWDVDPEILHIGIFHLRWYGLLFATGFFVGYFIMKKFFRESRIPLSYLDALTVYVVLGTVIGARLGHVLFYAPDYYLAHPVEIVQIWKGGLASHGGAIGILIALWLFTRKYRKIELLWLLDRLVIPAALGGALIRIGNLFNSEIIGKPTDLPWAFIFVRVDSTPRHPSQIYEALAYLGVFLLLWFYYQKHRPSPPRGKLFGWFLILVFTARFFIEFVKEIQEPFEAALPLDMGQILSIPFILVGAYFVFRSSKTMTKTASRSSGRKVKEIKEERFS